MTFQASHVDTFRTGLVSSRLLKRACVGIGTLAVVWAISAIRLEAGTIAFTFTNPVTGSGSVIGNDGFKFTPTVNVNVTHLGYYDRNQNGLTLSHPTAIYDVVTQTLLASIVVGPASTLDGLFRYEAITPLQLNAGQSYMVVGFHPGTAGDQAVLNPLGFAAAPQITYQSYHNNTFGSLSLPVGPAISGTRYFGPNFKFEEVPEPSMILLVAQAGLGLLAVGWWRARKRAA